MRIRRQSTLVVALLGDISLVLAHVARPYATPGNACADMYGIHMHMHVHDV